MIVDDILKAVNEKRSPLVLTKRKDHLQSLTDMLKDKVKNVVVFKSGLGKRQRAQLTQKLLSIPRGDEPVVVATGQSIGEGFERCPARHVVPAMPISWRGTQAQYAGRLDRSSEGKSVVQIYDYVDVRIDKLYGMFKKRQAGYKKIGYKIEPLVAAPISPE